MRTKFKKIISIYIFLQLLFISILISGCSEKIENKSIKVGVTISNFEDKFISYILTEMKEYQNNYGDKMEVIYMDAKEDREKQEDQVRYLIEEGVDVVVILPVDTMHTTRITNLLIDSNIPGVYINKYPDELNKEHPYGIYYVGSDENTSGVMQMEYLSKILEGKGDIVILVGELGDNAALIRTEGVEKVASEYPGINIVDKQSAKWITPLASSIVEHWIDSGKKFDAIAANNDEMAIGAIRALKKHEKLEEVIVVGIDATDEALNEIKNGRLKATVFQDSKSQAREALDIAFKVSTGITVPEKTWIPFKLVTSKNYQEFIR